MVQELDLSKIVQYPLPENQYVCKDNYGRELIYPKTSVTLHGTASGPKAKNVIDYWNQTSERVATPVVIDASGEIWQCYSSKFYAGHIGYAHGIDIYKLPFTDYSAFSIGIEICNWGWLVKRGDKYYSWTNAEIPANQVVIYDVPFKQVKYYHKYTAAQIESVRQLLVYWNKRYNIPLEYKPKELWALSKEAHMGVPGIYTHNSWRFDKSDIHPQPEMITMLKNLTVGVKNESKIL